MENVPWHEDVKAFAEAIAAERGGAEYELACEHSHSCCVLLAKTSKFKVNGKWHTWIDYEKFQDLVSTLRPQVGGQVGQSNDLCTGSFHVKLSFRLNYV